MASTKKRLVQISVSDPGNNEIATPLQNSEAVSSAPVVKKVKVVKKQKVEEPTPVLKVEESESKPKVETDESELNTIDKATLETIRTKIVDNMWDRVENEKLTESEIKQLKDKLTTEEINQRFQESCKKVFDEEDKELAEKNIRLSKADRKHINTMRGIAMKLTYKGETPIEMKHTSILQHEADKVNKELRRRKKLKTPPVSDEEIDEEKQAYNQTYNKIKSEKMALLEKAGKLIKLKTEEVDKEIKERTEKASTSDDIKFYQDMIKTLLERDNKKSKKSSSQTGGLKEPKEPKDVKGGLKEPKEAKEPKEPKKAKDTFDSNRETKVKVVESNPFMSLF